MKKIEPRKIMVAVAVIALAFTACPIPMDSPQSSGRLPSLHLSIAPYERGGPNALHRNIWRDTTVSLSGTPFAFGEVGAQARGRGNSSWAAMGNKRPLRFRFRHYVDGVRNDTPRPMFGSSYSAMDWTLIANAVDHSLMRSYAAYFLGHLLSGLDFSPARHFLHLYMNGEYRGVYMLSDQMEAGRMGLLANRGLPPYRNDYFLEMCHRVPEENAGYSYVYFIVQGQPFEIRYPGNAIRREGGWDFAKNFMHMVDAALVSGDVGAISRLIDIPSFIDFYLVQELFKNRDVGFSSVFFQIRQVNGNPKLFAGPLWDFDLSSGSHFNRDWNSDRSPQGAWAATQNRFFRYLMNTDWFREKAGARWSEIRNDEVQEMIARIRHLSATYRSCFERNFRRWPNKNVWVTAPELVRMPFAGQVDFLINWLERRKVWMDGFLGA